VTHHGELAVPWVRQYVTDLVARFVAGLEVDMTGLMARFQGATDPEQLQELFADPGEVMGLEIGPEQQETLDHLQAVLAILEGYADHLISSTAVRLIPDLAAIRSAAITRRDQPPEDDETGMAGGGMLGISIDREHADDAAGFCAEVERRLGKDRLDEIWEGPEHLPKLSELTDPVGWAARRL
jgi:putative hydrolase